MIQAQKMKSEEELRKIRESIPKRITFDLEEFTHFMENVNLKKGIFSFENEELIYDFSNKATMIPEYFKLTFEIYKG